MKSIYPEKLKSGDTICVIAPSYHFSSIKKSAKNLFLKRFKDILGLNVILGKKINSRKNLFNSSNTKDRVKDFNDAFTNKNIKGIACAQGGYNSNEILPYINWDIIKKNPKPFWGYSDITVLANAIYAKTGIVTYIAPNVSTFGKKEEKGIVEYMLENFQRCLMNEKPFEVLQSKYFHEKKTKAKRNSGPVILQKGTAKGVIVGGNLCSLNLLQGTEYMPSLKNKILFLEDDAFGGKKSFMEFARNFESLLQCKDASSIKGVVFGRFQKEFNMDIKKMKHLIDNSMLSKNIPIIYNVDFGHTHPMITFPVGGVVSLNTKNNKATINFLRY